MLGMLLGPPFRLGRGGPGGWILDDEPEVDPGTHVLVPDLAGWRVDGGDALDLTGAYTTHAPDWVCEVLSPATQGSGRVRKLPSYAAQGVSHVWLLDPISRTLEVFALHEQRWLRVGTYAEDASIAAPPFEPFELPLAELWVDP